jgi:prolyl 4-hydroxylase
MPAAKVASRNVKAPSADQAALARLGRQVRARLAADPAVYHVPCDKAEIYAVAEFLSAAECARIISMIDEVARPSPVYGNPEGASYRTSSSGDVDPTDSFVRMIERRICDLMGIEQSWSETFQGQRYRPGEEFQGHYDWYDTTGDAWADEMRRAGQRSWTAMVWLNDIGEGGETKFTRLGLGFPPQAGSLLMWNNMQPDGRPNLEVLHAGMPVVKGVKYVITKWFRTRKWS